MTMRYIDRWMLLLLAVLLSACHSSDEDSPEQDCYLDIHVYAPDRPIVTRGDVGEVPPDFPEEYFAAFAASYGHIQQIDRHRPWTEPLCAAIIHRAAPKYLTHELSSGYPGGQLGAVKRQLATLRRR